MSPSSSRFIAALLSGTPGSEVTEVASGLTIVHLATPIRQMVAVLEATDSTAQLRAQLDALAQEAQRGVPLQLMLVNPANVDVMSGLAELLEAPPLKGKFMSAATWVPGLGPIGWRTLVIPPIAKAATLANSDADLSLPALMDASHQEANVVRSFQAQVMSRRPVISYAIAAVCVALFALQWVWGDGEPIVAAARMGAEVPTRVMAGEWWRLFSVMLLHGNVLHLVLNMMAMLSFGPFLERLLGSSRYLILYVLSGLGGSLLSLTRGGDGIGVGASGGIWGLMVAGAVVVTWRRTLLPASVALLMRRRAWAPVAINLAYSFQPGIDMLAHVGGGVVGGLLVLALTWPRAAVPPGPLQSSPALKVAALAVGLVLTGSMGLALRDGQPWNLSAPWTLRRLTLEGTGVSVLVPERMDVEHAPQSLEWKFGDLNAVGVELFVMVTEPVSPDADLSHPLQDMLAEMEKPLDGFHYRQAPKVVKLDSGREAVFADLVPDAKDDARFLWQWWSFEEGNRWVRVLANALNSTSAERKQQLRAIANSVSTGPITSPQGPP
jgi:rhomboid protease GluP